MLRCLGVRVEVGSMSVKPFIDGRLAAAKKAIEDWQDEKRGKGTKITAGQTATVFLLHVIQTLSPPRLPPLFGSDSRVWREWF